MVVELRERHAIGIKQQFHRRWRSYSTHFPFILSAKYNTFNLLTEYAGLKVDAEFRVLKHFGPINLAIDIGSNWGQSIVALKRFAKPARIVGYEPIPSLAKRLQRQYCDNPAIEIHHRALSDCDGALSIKVPYYRGCCMDGLSAIDEADIHSWLGNPDLFTPYDPSLLEIVPYDVVATTLDSYNLQPDIVKIDVQGAESLVVAGGDHTFRTCKPIAIIEAPSNDLVRFFTSIGMNPYSTDGRKIVPYDRPTKNVLFLDENWLNRFQP